MVLLSMFMVLAGIDNPYEVSREDYPFNWSPLLYLREVYLRNTHLRTKILFFRTKDLLLTWMLLLQYFVLQYFL